VHSAVVRHLVPTLAEQAMQKLSVVYGARYSLRHGDDPRVFQKMYRDNQVMGLFDGSTQVSLFNLSQQLRSLIIHMRAAEVPGWAHNASEPTELDWTMLSLSARGRDAVLAGFDAGCYALRAAMQQHACETRQSIEISLVRLQQARVELSDAILRLSPGAFAAGDPAAFELARHYCVVAAAAAVLADWQVNRAALVSTLADPAVLAVVLYRLTAQLGELPLPTACYRDCFTALLARRERYGRCGLYAMPTEETSPLS